MENATPTGSRLGGISADGEKGIGEKGIGKERSGTKPHVLRRYGPRRVMNSLGFSVEVARPRWSLEGAAVAFHLGAWSAQA